ncbi:MAG: FAD-binding oxidoreductase [Oligoflexia bacterium]|nr:FAD-binding oxidoreductase [Oligoflexia bacterium]
MEHVETLVIGGGLAGAAVAAAAAAQGPLLVLEQGPQVAAEASAQNAGMVRLLVEDPVERRLALRSQDLLAELDERWEAPPSRVTGAVHGLVEDPSDLDEAVAALRAAGHTVAALDPEGPLPPAMAGARLRRAWSVPGARVADPHALVTGLLQDARARGATVRTGLRVQSLVIESGRIAGVQTEQGPLACDRLILAAGAWSGVLVAPVAAVLGLRRPLYPVRRSVLQTAAHPLSHPEHPWCWLEDLGLYVRPEGGGWLVSGCDERLDRPPPGPGSTGPVDPAWRELLSARLLDALPALADVGWAGGWTGLRTFAPDRRPILGPDPDIDGLHWAAGLGGFGVTTHLAVGEAVATWMRGGALPWLRQEDVSPSRSYPHRWVIRPLGTHRGGRLVAG